ncbi:MAG: hypothetical protein AB8E82_01440 [Aureispira sp.]
MMIPKSLSVISFFVLMSLLFVVACAEVEPQPPKLLLDRMDKETVTETTSKRTTKLASENKNEVSFSVVYTGDLEEILFNSTNHFHSLIETYKLQLSAPFEIDETMSGIVLKAHELLENPLDIAKEISLCAEVLMVDVKNLPDTERPSL